MENERNDDEVLVIKGSASASACLTEWVTVQDDCHHDKVYSPWVMMSNPPQYRWICRKCLAEGVDYGQAVMEDEYEQLKKQKDTR